AGPTREEVVPYTVWFWDGTGKTAKPLATLDLGNVPPGKAEILLPLEEDSSSIRVLVMFDGVENGGATSFRLQR
ncbi:MAG: hypothetical protein K2X57_21165, partial [Xanthobacteraceae bacterium]|nr:hypothetical protein [Xanthobacteraceae bacterium]